MMHGFFKQLAFWRECKELGQSIWMCPNFLFLVTGITTIVVMVASFLFGQQYGEPEFVIPVVIIATLFVFIPGSLIVQSFERVAKANRLKSEFLSIVSHQIRAPLSSIRWATESLEYKNIDGDIGDYVNIVGEGSQEMLNLVNNLLNSARLEEGRMEIKRVKLHLREVAQSVIRQMQPLADKKDIKVNLSADADLPLVEGDEVNLKVVFTNLIDNALKYSGEGSTVDVRLSKVDARVRCEVRDHGVGIGEKEQQFIFEKFFRAQGPLKKKTSGSGLGLYIVKQIIDIMDGKVGFESVEGEGATFWFELPTVNQ